MRTTLNLDDDVARVVREHAESRSITLGKAASQLVRRGIMTPRRTRIVNGLQVFDLPSDSPRVTTKRVREIEAALEESSEQAGIEHPSLRPIQEDDEGKKAKEQVRALRKSTGGKDE